MANISSLPREILLNIFLQIGTATQAGRCRLVCRQWNSPAEEAMLGCKVILDSLDKAIQLYGHLCTDITKRIFIKHLHFEMKSNDLPLIYKHLLPLAFTPSIELLTGTVCSNNFFSTLIQIADDTSTEFSRLKELPDSLDNDGDINMIEAAIKFNFKSLYFTLGTRHMGLNWSVINMLDKFKSLETLKLTGYISLWKNLEKALKRCPNIKKLFLQDLDPVASKGTVAIWVRENVSQNPSLPFIELDNIPLRPDLLEYLMYKYSGNVGMIKSHSHILYNSNSSDDLNRVLDALDGVKIENLTFILPDNMPVKKALTFLKTQKEVIDLSTGRHQGQEKVIMKVN